MRDSTGLWRKVGQYIFRKNDANSSPRDALLWSKDLEKHGYGDLSFAMLQANKVMEDYGQVEIGRDATFVGVYDGHVGPAASRFICDNLYPHLMRLVRENGAISEDVLRSAFSATEDGFLSVVRKRCRINPSFAAIGSCCLAGVILGETLYVANLGDSRAIIGSLGRLNEIIADQLTRDHNANMEEVRQELRSLHPDDSNIVALKHNLWRIKGIIQVSRSIGDAYMKRPEFSIVPPRFQLSEPLCRPVLTAEPSIYTRVLQPNDKFLIFASDGLWEHLSNQEAAEIVHNNPRAGVARRLIEKASEEAASKRDMTYNELKKIDRGVRRYFHDDITVAVIFIDHDLLGKGISVPEQSIRGFVDTAGPSDFNILQGMMQMQGPVSEITNPGT